jgi:hypothetical protein
MPQAFLGIGNLTGRVKSSGSENFAEVGGATGTGTATMIHGPSASGKPRVGLEDRASMATRAL